MTGSESSSLARPAPAETAAVVESNSGADRANPAAGPRELGRSERLRELDVLRGIAALTVVLFHYTVRFAAIHPYPTPPPFRLTYGFYGVEIFFGISGFVIFMTLDRTRRPLDFVVSRFSRLWPAYIAAMAITFTVVHLAGLSGREVNVVQALVNLTMFQELLHVPHVDGVYWTLQVELIFYCWMLAAFTLSLLPRIRLLALLAMLPPVAYFCARVFLHRELSWTLGELMIVRFSPFFVIGIAAYHIRKSSGLAVYDLLLMAAAVVVSSLCPSPWELPAGQCAGASGICPSIANSVVALCSSIIFYAVARGHLRWMSRQPLMFLGDISYTLYLVHQNIGYVVIRGAIGEGLPTDASILLAVGTSIAIAAMLTYAIERPAKEWIRSWYKAWKIASASAARASVA